LIGLYFLCLSNKQIVGLLFLLLYVSSVLFWRQLYIISFIRIIDRFIIAITVIYIAFVVLSGSSFTKKIWFTTALFAIGCIFYLNELVYIRDVEIPAFFEKYIALCKLNISKELFNSVMPYLLLENMVRFGKNGLYIDHISYHNKIQETLSQYRFILVHSVFVHLGFACTVFLAV